MVAMSRDWIAVADDALDVGEACLLATVVRLDGSGYGRPGARLLATESGLLVGYISGGCLERDLIRRAWPATRSGPRVISFDTRGNAVGPDRHNTGCEGVVHVLCRRLEHRDDDAVRIPRRVRDGTNPIDIATAYRVGDDSAFRIGEIVPADDPRIGVHPPRPGRWQRLGDGTEVLWECLTRPRRLVIVGGGDDALPVAVMGGRIGRRVTIVEPRTGSVTGGRFGDASVVASVEAAGIDGRTDVLLMTHDIGRDAAALPSALHAGARTVGVLGPKHRLARLVQRVIAGGRRLTDDEVSRIRGPIGSDIGGIGPEEIAVSIIAELIAIDRGRHDGGLHRRTTPIHDDDVHDDGVRDDGVRDDSVREPIIAKATSGPFG